ncbi:hypothetical protein EMCG_00310 [[Emmonsia] crescens]|uniref:Major facilitator superfamily (MFS) profile domain-containing protein n=1 Tax=[Emmonsia] crescens TaxID=73230 RepID=A0A0G2HZ42_9EURO|nr:hypothetical protein EMCG_00310 [Emmonsia crescens UAMH 3008]
MAAVLAVQAMFANVGGAIGQTIATFAGELAEFSQDESQGNLTSIYDGLTVQLSYPVVSPRRTARRRSLYVQWEYGISNYCY